VGCKQSDQDNCKEFCPTIKIAQPRVREDKNACELPEWSGQRIGSFGKMHVSVISATPRN
jgi:hypothetical protein